MTEALLHYIWKFRLFDSGNFFTKTGEQIDVLHPGIHNPNSGPDFLQAKIRIGNKVWVGNVEIHLQAHEWYGHQHQQDNAYNNVVLHVVFNSSNEYVTAKNGAQIPCAELCNLIDKKLLHRYALLMNSAQAIPCASGIVDIDDFTIQHTLSNMAVERLEEKVATVLNRLENSNGDWELTAWKMIARYLSSGVNRDMMEAVVGNLNINILCKHQDKQLQIEAMMFGIAGLLEESFKDDYPLQLQREFKYLKRLHGLKQLEPGVFMWAKIRPANFPTIRLAQLAALVSTDVKFFARLMFCNTLRELEELFNVVVHPYWQNHYRFDETTDRSIGKIGKSTIHIIILNAIIPLLFAYGKYKGEEKYKTRALQMLESLKAEANTITKTFRSLGINATSALESQGMIQLKLNYCDKFKCLDCTIGNKILRKPSAT